MQLLELVLLTLGLTVFLTCTAPGFLHVTGLRKNNKLHMVCLVLGILFGLQLLSTLLSAVLRPCNCARKNCACKRNGKCSCGKGCNC